MAFLQRAIRAPECLNCVRTLTRPEPLGSLRPFIQIRGKKKKNPNRHHMAIVKLQRDTIGFGPKGTILSITPGMMRNHWFPSGIAEYMTGADLVEVKRRPELIRERDSLFGTLKQQEQPEEVVTVDTQLLTPGRSEELLQTLLPDYIEIFRPPISAAEQSKMELPEAEVGGQDAPQQQAIYGSVSTQDILQNIKEYMTLKGAEAANADAGRVVLQPSDIKLLHSDVRTGVEEDRIKFLGEFEFELQVKGAGTVKRKIRVSAQT